MTQQLVRRSDGTRALTDMYFPQFGIHLEIDEEQHEKDAHKLADEKRSQDIVSVTDHQIERIKASTSLEHVVKQTDKFVKKIQELRDQLKAQSKFIAWDGFVAQIG